MFTSVILNVSSRGDRSGLFHYKRYYLHTVVSKSKCHTSLIQGKGHLSHLLPLSESESIGTNTQKSQESGQKKKKPPALYKWLIIYYCKTKSELKRFHFQPF